MFDSVARAVETLTAEYAAHSAVEPAFDLTEFFEPALDDTEPRETVGQRRERRFRSTIERGQTLSEQESVSLPIEAITERLVDVANDQSIEARRRAAFLDYCDALFAFAALAFELQERYPSAPVATAVDRLHEAGDAAVADDLSGGLSSLRSAGHELYRTAVVVRRADQLFAALSAVGEPQLGRAEATLGGTLDEAIAERDTDRIDTVAERLNAATDGEWTSDDLLSCSHREFEVLIADLWREGGFDARTTKYVQDYNVDVIAQADGTRELVQAKQYKPGNKVGVRTVQRTAGLLVEFDADSVAVVTSSSFTENARESVERMSEQVRLVDGEQLCELLTRSQLVPSL